MHLQFFWVRRASHTFPWENTYRHAAGEGLAPLANTTFKGMCKRDPVLSEFDSLVYCFPCLCL
jgi:hypothetical protein